MYELGQAPDKPADLLARMEALLARPGKDTAQAFRDCVIGFRDWGLTNRQAFARFIMDSEWNWRDGRAPLGDG